MKFWRLTLLLASVLLLAGGIKSLLDYWQYDEFEPDVVQMLLHQVSADDVRKTVRESIAADKPEEARMYLSLAQQVGYKIAPTEFEAELRDLESPLNTARRTVNDFTSGFVEGAANSGAGVAGAMASDFTVVGDVRDLWEQYQLYSQGKPVNELVVTLAGVGVGLTAATVASMGATTPAKGGVSTSKLAARAGKLTPNFQKFLLKQGSDVFDYKAFMLAARAERSMDGVGKAAMKAYNPQAVKALQNTAERVNNIRKLSSTSDALHLLQYVENSDDLIRIEKLVVRHGAEAKGILKFLGKSAIGTVRVLHQSVELFVSALLSLISFVSTLLSLAGLRNVSSA